MRPPALWRHFDGQVMSCEVVWGWQDYSHLVSPSHYSLLSFIFPCVVVTHPILCVFWSEETPLGHVRTALSLRVSSFPLTLFVCAPRSDWLILEQATFHGTNSHGTILLCKLVCSRQAVKWDLQRLYKSAGESADKVCPASWKRDVTWNLVFHV